MSVNPYESPRADGQECTRPEPPPAAGPTVDWPQRMKAEGKALIGVGLFFLIVDVVAGIDTVDRVFATLLSIASIPCGLAMWRLPWRTGLLCHGGCLIAVSVLSFVWALLKGRGVVSLSLSALVGVPLIAWGIHRVRLARSLPT